MEMILKAKYYIAGVDQGVTSGLSLSDLIAYGIIYKIKSANDISLRSSVRL